MKATTKAKRATKAGKNGKSVAVGGGRLGGLLGEFAEGGVIDVDKEIDATRNGHPVRCDKIPRQKERQAELDAFLVETGIEPITGAAVALCDDGGVFSLFVAEFSPEAMKKVIKRHNAHNRQVGAARAKTYATDMTTGDWIFTGEPILFSREGDLLDGQNRMLAGVAAGQTLVFTVGFGLSTKAAVGMGRHFGRTNQHQDQVEGQAYANARKPVVTLLHRFEKSDEAADYLEKSGAAGLVLGGPQYKKVSAHYEQELGPALEFIHGLDWKRGPTVALLPRHVAAFAFMVMSRISPEAARYFMHTLAQGSAMPNTPIWALNYALQKLATAKRAGSQVAVDGEESRCRESVILRYFAAAWSSFCGGKKNSTGALRRLQGSTSTLLRSLPAPGPKALTESKSFTDKAHADVIARARKCNEVGEAKALALNSDEGDKKLSQVQLHLQTV